MYTHIDIYTNAHTHICIYCIGRAQVHLSNVNKSYETTFYSPNSYIYTRTYNIRGLVIFMPINQICILIDFDKFIPIIAIYICRPTHVLVYRPLATALVVQPKIQF